MSDVVSVIDGCTKAEPGAALVTISPVTSPVFTSNVFSVTLFIRIVWPDAQSTRSASGFGDCKSEGESTDDNPVELPLSRSSVLFF